MYLWWDEIAFDLNIRVTRGIAQETPEQKKMAVHSTSYKLQYSTCFLSTLRRYPPHLPTGQCILSIFIFRDKRKTNDKLSFEKEKIIILVRESCGEITNHPLLSSVPCNRGRVTLPKGKKRKKLVRFVVWSFVDIVFFCTLLLGRQNQMRTRRPFLQIIRCFIFTRTNNNNKQGVAAAEGRLRIQQQQHIVFCNLCEHVARRTWTCLPSLLRSNWRRDRQRGRKRSVCRCIIGRPFSAFSSPLVHPPV